MRVAEPHLASRYFQELEARLRDEWPQIQSVRGDGHAVPEPLVVLAPDEALAGGLSFLEAESPTGEGRALWINAVLVSPPYRRRGVASLLIQAAQATAKHAGVSHLYALTEVPDLYSKQGWSVFSHSGVDFVMTHAAGDTTRTQRLRT